MVDLPDIKPALSNPLKGKSKPVIIVTVIAALGIGGYIWWHNKQATDAATSSPDTADAIDPATGLPFSAETGVDTGANLGTGSEVSGVPVDAGGTGITTNAEWSQAVVDQLGETTDETAILAALGDYLASKPLTAAEAQIVREAWAVEGYPPQGPTTYTLAGTASTPGVPPPKTPAPPTKPQPTPAPPPKKTKAKTYTVRSGDTLTAIAGRVGVSESALYSKNRSVIEAAAKAHGKKSSDNGHWIYPGTTLTIP